MYFTAFDGHLYRLRRSRRDLKAIAASFPERLSETGLFDSVADMKPAAGIIPYDVNVPLWSDGAGKDRLMALPAAGSVVFDEREQWGFPVGTVLIKTFFLPLDNRTPAQQRRLETRLFVHSDRGWRGYVYKWNDKQTDALLLRGARTETYRVKTKQGMVQREWYYPSGADCMACHTESAGFVLGPSTRQMNRLHDYGTEKANQISYLSRLGIFSQSPSRRPEQLEAYPTWGDKSAPIDTLSRAYLDVNCAMCHARGALRGQRPDFSFRTLLTEASLLGVEPGQGRMGPRNSKLITPGNPEGSELLKRMAVRGPRQMPPLASNVLDEAAIELIHRWIEEMQ